MNMKEAVEILNQEKHRDIHWVFHYCHDTRKLYAHDLKTRRAEFDEFEAIAIAKEYLRKRGEDV